MVANSDGTAAPMSSVMLSPRNALAGVVLCDLHSACNGILPIEVRETRNAHNA